MKPNVIPFPTGRARAGRLVDLAGLHERFGFSERWWRYRIKEGMPVHRWGGGLRFDPDEVEAWNHARGTVGDDKAPPHRANGRGQATPTTEA